MYNTCVVVISLSKTNNVFALRLKSQLDGSQFAHKTQEITTSQVS